MKVKIVGYPLSSEGAKWISTALHDVKNLFLVLTKPGDSLNREKTAHRKYKRILGNDRQILQLLS